jgi:hypothetical protein
VDGGHIVDGRDFRWARVLVHEPHDRVVFSWAIGPDWEGCSTRTAALLAAAG